MRELYPPITPYEHEMLDVSGGHTIYVEQCGNPEAIPVVFLHGGPGSGCKADHRRFFDPRRYRTVLFDQRGSGRSRPWGGVENNTTQELIADLEHIRERYGIEQWALFGGSWGAALALLYAQAHSERVSGLVLRGTFLARQSDVDWFFRAGANRLLPVQWQRFLEALDLEPDTDFGTYMHEAVFGADAALAQRVARAWEAWSGAVVMYSIDQAGDGVSGPIDAALAKARLEMHYARHRYFLRENQLLEETDRLPEVPITLVHGARDITCTADSAWALHRAVPHSRLEILRTAGHLSSERPMIDALVRAADALADTLS